MVTRRSVNCLLVALIIGLVGFYAGQFLTREKNTNDINPLDSLITLETDHGKLEILISANQVYLQPFEAAEDNRIKAITLTREQYPKLFRQGVAKSSFITAKIELGGEDGQRIVISNNQPDHGGYSQTYQLTINLVSGQIRE